MNVIEKFICGKKNDPALCEDIIVTTPDFMAVIDGATSKSCPPLGGMTSGRFAAQTVADGLQNLPADIEGLAAMRRLSHVLREAVTPYMNVVAGTESPSCCLAVYSRARREIWRVGDIAVMLDGQLRLLPKSIDAVTADARAAMIEALLRSGETVESLLRDDKGRAFIFPLLARQHLFANRADAGDFGFGVMNGAEIPEKFIDIIDANAVREIVLASDGYPVLHPALAQSEAALAKVLRDDPLLFRLHKSTKGMQAGQVSFDDRSYLRFTA